MCNKKQNYFIPDPCILKSMKFLIKINSLKNLFMVIIVSVQLRSRAGLRFKTNFQIYAGVRGPTVYSLSFFFQYYLRYEDFLDYSVTCKTKIF